MRAGKKKTPHTKEPALLEMPFQEALSRFIQTDPKELVDLAEKIKRQDGEIERYVDDRQRSIRSGARRTGKRFRI